MRFDWFFIFHDVQIVCKSRLVFVLHVVLYYVYLKAIILLFLAYSFAHYFRKYVRLENTLIYFICVEKNHVFLYSNDLL